MLMLLLIRICVEVIVAVLLLLRQIVAMDSQLEMKQAKETSSFQTLP
jgi:hypothetical protein